MSEYPKAIQLFGKTHILSGSTSTWYRVDSVEEEERIRTRHTNQVIDTLAELERLFREAAKP